HLTLYRVTPLWVITLWEANNDYGQPQWPRPRFGPAAAGLARPGSTTETSPALADRKRHPCQAAHGAGRVLAARTAAAEGLGRLPVAAPSIAGRCAGRAGAHPGVRGAWRAQPEGCQGPGDHDENHGPGAGERRGRACGGAARRAACDAGE